MEWMPLNFGLMKNPLNWVIIFLMVYLFLIPVALVERRFVGS